MTSNDPWTIKRLLDWTTEYFAEHGSDSARLEAEVLLAEALDCSRIDLYTRFSEVPGEPGLGKYRQWVKRHAAGEPVAYLVGHREFYSLRFEVDANVLIPRPETEHVVVEAIDCLKKIDIPHPQIADIGTGSGCIAITLAKQVPGARVVAADVSRAALEVARRNAGRHHVEDRIEFVESDLFASIPDRRFQLIVSNPPYVGSAEQGTLDENVRKYEPGEALFAGPRGTEIIERLVKESADRLGPDGFLVFETSPIIMQDCVEFVRQSSAFADEKIVKDLAGHERVVVARRI